MLGSHRIQPLSYRGCTVDSKSSSLVAVTTPPRQGDIGWPHMRQPITLSQQTSSKIADSGILYSMHYKRAPHFRRWKQLLAPLSPAG